MRVLHIVPAFPPNNFVLKDMSYCERIAGIETLVVSAGGGKGRSNLLSTILRTLRCSLKILRIRPDVIHCHFMTSTLPAALIPIPAVVTIHESYSWLSFVWRTLLKLTTRRCRIIYVSNYNRRFWIPILQKEGTVIYHAIDTGQYNPSAFSDALRDSIKAELKVDYLVFTMGVLEPRRGLHLTVKAARILRNKGINVGVVLKGYGGQANYATKIESLASRLEVPLKGITRRLTDSEMASLHASVDAFVRPTTVESFGIAVLESQACGTPTIVTDCCSLKEVFGDSSLLFEPMNHVDLARQMELVLTDSSVRKEYREKGLKHAAQLSWGRKVREYLATYLSAIHGKDPRGD